MPLKTKKAPMRAYPGRRSGAKLKTKAVLINRKLHRQLPWRNPHPLPRYTLVVGNRGQRQRNVHVGGNVAKVLRQLVQPGGLNSRARGLKDIPQAVQYLRRVRGLRIRRRVVFQPVGQPHTHYWLLDKTLWALEVRHG
jgi:hypothetical protein